MSPEEFLSTAHALEKFEVARLCLGHVDVLGPRAVRRVIAKLQESLEQGFSLYGQEVRTVRDMHGRTGKGARHLPVADLVMRRFMYVTRSGRTSIYASPSDEGWRFSYSRLPGAVHLEAARGKFPALFLLAERPPFQIILTEEERVRAGAQLASALSSYVSSPD